MKINETYRIEIDKYNHTLERLTEVEDKKTKTKKMEWRQLGSYGSMAGCIKGAMRDDIKVCEDVKGIIERIELFEKTIECKFKGE